MLKTRQSELQQSSQNYTRADYAQHIKIINKHGVIVPFTPNHVQADYLAKRGKRNLILKARQLGMSAGIQYDMALEAMSQTSLQVTLAHDDTTTAILRRLSRRFYDSIPDAMKPKRNLDNATTTVFGHNGSTVTISTAGNVNKGIGGTYTRVHGSEVAKWKDTDAIFSGLLQGVPPDGQIDLESTAWGAQGWFYDRCLRAIDGDNEWTFHFYEWWWADEYQLPLDPDELHSFKLEDDEQLLVTQHGLTLEQIKWRRAKQRELPLTFFQEFPESPMQAFILSGQSVFGDVSKALYTPDETTPMKPIEKHRYVAGIDWGLDPDYTAISIIDSETDTEVYLARHNARTHATWEAMRSELIDACIHWNVETIQAEKNSMGGVNIESLKTECWAKAYHPNIRAVPTDNKKKTKWVSNFYKGIHEGGLQLLNKDYATRELHAFTQSQTDLGEYRYKASGTEHDDTVMARLLAWDAVNNLIG